LILEHLELDAFVDSTQGVEKENFLLDDTRRDRRSDHSKEVRVSRGERTGRRARWTDDARW
jgi:hypothetical protein